MVECLKIPPIDSNLLEAGTTGKLQWLGYWQPSYEGEVPPDSAWSFVYRHESGGMLWSYGNERFRIKPE